MASIPKTQQYYPSVPISEMTDLYSKGANTLNGKRAFIASYLPKTLRLSEAHPFNNHYVLFIEDTAIVNAINWEYQLYLNGESIAIANFITTIPATDQTQYSLYFSKDSIDILGKPIADKLVIKCTVQLGVETIVLEVEHDLVQMLDSKNLANLEIDTEICKPHQGNPRTTKYILNHLKDFLPNEIIQWNNEIIEIDLATEKENNLIKIVTGIIYNTIQVSISSPTGFNYLYNINQDRNKSVEAFLNDATPNKGDHKNGICKIPIHVLNEILIDLDTLPSFTDIDSGTGNPIFNILRANGTTTIEEKIAASKLKLETNSARFVELFNLTIFPKSSIKLCALVVKYLFEASKLNDCNECTSKEASWPTLTIDDLPENHAYVHNLLSLYFNGPTDRVSIISAESKKTTKHIWSPYVNTINNIAPRIIKAYFAKRLITKLEDETIAGVTSPVYTFKFERLDAAHHKQ